MKIDIDLDLGDIDKRNQHIFWLANRMLGSFIAALIALDVDDEDNDVIEVNSAVGMPDWAEELHVFEAIEEFEAECQDIAFGKPEYVQEAKKEEESGCSRKELEELSKSDPKTNYDW